MAKLSGQLKGNFQLVDTCPVISLPFEDHLSTLANQTDLRNKPQEKQTSKPLAMIHTWVVSLLV